MAIEYTITANHKQVMKAIQDVTAKIETLSSKMQAGGKSVDNYFGEIDKGAKSASSSMKELITQTAAFAGLSLGAAGVAQFAKSVVEVRKQMQSLQTSFKTLLGSEEKANAMFGELKQFAATTPLMLKDLAAGAQTMLGFNIEAEKVVPTLKAIGDISMGDAQKFQSLTLAFSQMSATGKLMGQDLLQMINAGFNPLSEISRKTGKSIAALKEEMSAGSISAQMVADAFMSATSKGGKFNGMLEEQGKTLAGQMNQLQGAIDDMFNAIGEQTEGVIKGAISATQTLVENYEKVGKVLTALIATYGTYKAALMAVNAVERYRIQQALAAASGVKNYSVALAFCTKVQDAFNKSALSNPYILVATALVAVVSAVWALSDGLTAAERAQQNLSKAQDDFLSQQETEKKKAKELISIIKSDSSTKQERVKAYKELSRITEDLCETYSLEQLRVLELKDAYELLEKSQNKSRSSFYTQQKEQVANIIAEINQAGGSWSKLSEETTKYLEDQGYTGKTLVQVRKELALVMTELIKQESAWEKELAALSIETAKVDEKKNKEYWEKQKKAAEAELAALTDIEAKGEKGAQIKKRIEGINKKLEAYNVSKKDNEALRREAKDREFKAAQYRIDAMEEGSAKVIAQAKLDYEKEQEAIERTRYDIKKNNGGKMSKNDEDYLLQWDATATKKYEKQLEEATKAEERAMNEYLAQYGELQERKAAIKKKYEEEAAKATTEGERLELKKKMDEDIKNAEQDAVSKALKDIQKDPAFFDAMTDIDNVATKTIERLVKKLEEAKTAMGDLDPENMKELADVMRQMEDALLERDNRPIEQFVKAQKELATASKAVTEAEKKVVEAQKEYDKEVKTNGKNSQQAKAAQQALTAATAEYDKTLNDEEKAHNKVLKASAKLKEQLNELGNAIKGVGDAVGGEAGMILNFIGDITNFVSSSIDNVKRMAAVGAQALSTIEKASVILTIIQAAIQIFQKLNEIMNKFSSAAAYDKAVEKQKAINKLTQSVNEYQLAILKATNAENSWFGSNSLGTMKTNFQEQAKTYENYMSKLNEQQVKYRNKSKNDNNWTNWLGALAPGAGLVGAVQMASSIGGLVDGFKKGDNGLVSAIDNLRIETRKRKKSVFGFGGHDQKTQDLRDWAREKYGDELFDSENFINTTLANQIIDDYGSKLQGDTKKTLEELVALKEQYDEYEQQLKDYVNDLYSPLVENMTDAIMTWLDTGKDALRSFKEAAADTFRDIVKDMVQTLVFNEVVGSFQDDIQGVYKEYQKGNMTEEEMSKQVALLTAELADRYETEIPVLQGIASDISTTLRDVTGIDISKRDEQTATQGIAASFSQDSIDEANGRMAALQMGQQTQIISTQNIAQALEKITSDSGNQSAHLNTLVDLAGLRNSYILDIYTRLGQMQATIDVRLKEISTNTLNM